MSLRPAGHGQLLPARSLRLAALEMSTKRADQEIMKDFFWTLYSKLDAVAQGLRVIYEVSNRIGSVSYSDHATHGRSQRLSRDETSRIRQVLNRARSFL